MAKNNKADMSCARVKKYTSSDVSKAERHNERKNETYENMNVIEERIPFNVHFKKPFAPTYMEQLKQMETDGLVSLRGLRKDATLFNEIVIDVNTMYFERNDSNGTGYAAHRDDILLAGKTGTAEIKASKDDTSGTELGWFAIFTAEDTECPILIISMVEDVKGRGGSGYVVKKDSLVLEEWFSSH